MKVDFSLNAEHKAFDFLDKGAVWQMDDSHSPAQYKSL
jgi:hypothetical protein